MPEQLTFTERMAQEAQREPDITEVADVTRELRKSAQLGQPWVLGKDLCVLVGWPDCEKSRRKFRKIVEQNRRMFSTSDHGYALTSYLPLKGKYGAAHSWHRRFAMGRELIEGAIRERNAWYANRPKSWREAA